MVAHPSPLVQPFVSGGKVRNVLNVGMESDLGVQVLNDRVESVAREALHPMASIGSSLDVDWCKFGRPFTSSYS